MPEVSLVIDDVNVSAPEGWTILEAARKADIYVPALCSYPSLPSAHGMEPNAAVFRDSRPLENTGSGKTFAGCQLCVVEVDGEGVILACTTPVKDGMVVHTSTLPVLEARRKNLAKILAVHPHACLVCPQQEGCDILRCSSGVPKDERCCPKFNNCELRKVAEYIGIPENTPRYTFQDLPIIVDEPLFKRDYNLCVNCLRCVKACQELRGVKALGFVFDEDGRIHVGTIAPSLKESGCKFCGACVEVCPTGALSDKDIKWTERETALVPCSNACPAGIDIPGYISLIAEGKLSEAVAVIREKVPFPGVLGCACYHPCETVCRRGELNEAIAICALKRFAAKNDTQLWKKRNKSAPSTGKRVAIIGSGPAGLTTAYYLIRSGHSVTVFEALSEAGGMMRVGIPEYRLPRHVLNSEIRDIQEAGVDIRTNIRIESIDSLTEQGYDAVLLAVGAHQGTRMGVEGEELSGVMDGASFLREVNLGKEVVPGNRVAVIGGGNSAIDSARVAHRLGAKEVTIIYRRTRAEMPASAEEVEDALHEGILIVFLAAPSKIIQKNGALEMECIRMRLGEPDTSGRRRPEPIPGSEFTQECDSVIAAIGQVPEIPSQFGVKIGRGNTLQIDSKMLQTSREGVFAAGDAITGPASVIEAIAAGRKAAISMDKYLGGEGIIDEKLVEAESPNPWLGREEGFVDWRREKPILSDGLTKEQAIQEAKRCLRCNLRLEISPPILPPRKCLRLEESQVCSVPETEGAIQLLDEGRNTLYIKGTANMRKELEEQLNTNDKARYFLYEEAPMYTSRESELLQQFLQQHGKLPPQNADLDDLFD